MLRAEKDLQWGRQFDMPALYEYSSKILLK